MYTLLGKTSIKKCHSKFRSQFSSVLILSKSTIHWLVNIYWGGSLLEQKWVALRVIWNETLDDIGLCSEWMTLNVSGKSKFLCLVLWSIVQCWSQYIAALFIWRVLEVLKLRDWLVDNTTLTHEVPSHNIKVRVCYDVSVTTITGHTFLWRQ